jgi:ankyrin repeat protein
VTSSRASRSVSPTCPAIMSTASRVLDALVIPFLSEQSRAGYVEDVRLAGGVCRELWNEERVWGQLVRLQRGGKKRTSLMYASMMGDHARVQWLLARGAPTELADVDGKTALIWAAIGGASSVGQRHALVVKLLLAAGADVNAPSIIRATPVSIASTGINLAVLRALVDAGANLDCDAVEGALVDASARHDGLDFVSALLQRGQMPRGRLTRALLCACRNTSVASLSIIKLLVARGADSFGVVADTAWSPFSFAVGHDPDLLLALLPCEMSVTSARREGQRKCAMALALVSLCERGVRDEIVERMIQCGADVNVGSGDGVTPIFAACANGHLSIVQTLIRAGADVNCKLDCGRTPIFSAALYGHDEIVQALLAAGSSVDPPLTESLATPLYVAVQEGNVKVVRVLVAWHANINFKTGGGLSLIEIAGFYNAGEELESILVAMRARA